MTTENLLLIIVIELCGVIVYLHAIRGLLGQGAIKVWWSGPAPNVDG